MIAGGNVNIRGPVHGDLRVAGGNVTFESTGSGDVNIAGGSIRVSKDAVIGKDMGIAGENVVFSGHVREHADIAAKNLDLDGVIDQSATIYMKEIANLRIGPNAKILGKLNYYSNERSPALEKIAVGGAEYKGATKF